MKKKFVLFSSVIFFTLLLIGVNSCKDEEVEFVLETLMAGTIDLNGATSPSNVPPNPVIEGVFSTDVDAATVTSATITLTRDYDNAVIALTLTTSGKKITVDPNEDLGNGALYVLSFKAGIKSSDGQDLPAFNRSFTTSGNFVPAGVIAWWNFDNNPFDQVGGYDPVPSDVIDVTYVESRNANAGTAASFNGTTTLIEVPNGDELMTTSDFTLSFWVKTNSADKTNSHFVLGLAGWYGFQYEIFGAYDGCKLAAQYDIGDGTSASEDLWFNGNGETWENGGWMGWTFCKLLTPSPAEGMAALLKDKWAHIVCVYNSSTKTGTMYINGERMKEQDFNRWPEGDAKRNVVGLKYAGNANGNNLAFGFIQGRNNRIITDDWADYANPENNHFKGLLDDVRIFHKVLTPTEIDLMYQSEKP